MFAEEHNLLSHQEKSCFMDNYDDDDASGRLSFCDLPLTANICDWNPSKEVYENSPSDQDVFEFITTKDLFTGYVKDHIIFCGKLIPYKTPKLDNTISNSQKSPKKSKSYNRGGEAKKDRNNDASVWANTRLKSSRWYMLAFGTRRFQMELSDIKARQARRYNSMKKVVASQSHDHVVGGIDQTRVKTEGKKRGKVGLWGLLRFLGCKGLYQNANTIVKSSTG